MRSNFYDADFAKSEIMADACQVISDLPDAQDRISVGDLVAALLQKNCLWREWNYGRPITTAGILQILKYNGIRPQTICSGHGWALKGYTRKQLEDAARQNGCPMGPENTPGHSYGFAGMTA